MCPDVGGPHFEFTINYILIVYLTELVDSWTFLYIYIYIFLSLSLCRSFLHLGAGLSVGLSGLAAGFAIGIVGDAGVRGTAQQPRLFVGMILILIFAEVLGLYGLIVALILSTK